MIQYTPRRKWEDTHTHTNTHMIQDKAWRKREETWEKEKAARAKLMKDVISARREQLETQLEKNKAGI
jgi:hypothetical protein